jgi:hypothetical protein
VPPLPLAFELAPASASEDQLAVELLARTLQLGQVVLVDKGFTGEKLERLVTSFGCQPLHPDRRC